MTLAPDQRALLTEALRPPSGFDLDQAVATTYTLSLDAALLIPLTFAFPNQEASDDPIATLDAVQRYAQRLTIFAQSGAITTTRYRSLFAFMEEAIYEVDPANIRASPRSAERNRIFHPKSWALRFADESGGYLHRLVVASRNLTFDTSWDTVLVLNEGEGANPIDSAPISRFLRALPGLAHSIPKSKVDDVENLAQSFESATLIPPRPYDSATVVPLGLTGPPPTWPLPEHVDRMLAISPFLDKTMVRYLPGSRDRTLLAAPESLNRIGASTAKDWRTTVLSHAAAIDADDATQPHAVEQDPGTRESDLQSRGLHAKVVIADLPRGSRGQSVTITGSANLTSAAWGRTVGAAEGNVELAVVLTGHRKHVGVGPTLEGESGLGRVIEEFQPATDDGETDPLQDLTFLIEGFHRKLAATDLTASLTTGTENTFTLKFDTAQVAHANLPDASTQVWPLSLHHQSHRRQATGAVANWEGLDVTHVTPFLAVRTTVRTDVGQSSRECVLRLSLTGDSVDRRRAAVREHLRDRDQMLRYLGYLLGSPTTESQPHTTARAAGGSAKSVGAVLAVPDLFERLVRAAAHSPEVIERIQQTLDSLDLTESERQSLLPAGFTELWLAVTGVAP